ncbi:similar to Saccharomyces cerevisiae YIR021W MRS1 Protein required for the splicing of two mitochondrial group I introns (BI3 in COB and AI5beta in COX1) [Maudiozyma barnettii]|nr:similar to Saccharomyces cerevisiae YIR021W MRS1 Protein required for the splicing of two mitochondrial group I introns (BI3 in COB and AI5beta in COX1) [Kazachstania barnettii]
MNLPVLCKELKSNTLQRLAFLIGAKQDTKKALRIKNIQERFTLFHALSQTVPNNHANEITITSVDTGVVNCAVASMTIAAGTGSLPRLNYWKKWNLESQFLGVGQSLTLSPQLTSMVTGALVAQLLRDPGIEGTTLFTIEKQRARTVSSRVVSDPILKLNIVEHLLYDKLGGHGAIESSDPARMTKFWVPQELLKQEQEGAKFNSKRARMDLVKAMVFQGSPGLLTLSDPIDKQIQEYQTPSGESKGSRRGRMPRLFDALQLQEPMNGARKDDDLADSLLHALAWSQWYKTYNELNQLLMKSPLHSQLDEYIHRNYEQWQGLLMNQLQQKIIKN